METRDPAPRRVLVAAAGPDGDDTGVGGLAIALRDAGYEVIQAGSGQPAAAVARMAVDEDVDAVGVWLDDAARRSEGKLDAERVEARLVADGADVPVVEVSSGDRPEAMVAALDAAFG